MWKPGQIVTIYHKRYRVKKTTCGGDCFRCDFRDLEPSTYPCDKCTDGLLMQNRCHLVRTCWEDEFNTL